MMRKFILLLSISLLSFSTNVFAQSIADLNSPKILPPAPDAAALGKYGQIPVDKSTGIPNISVPIYDIKTPRFILPISLSYHASGIKVDETASWVGLGWSLNAGGVVTRSMLGLPDNGPNGYLSLTSLPTTQSILMNYKADSVFLLNICNNLQDSQPDNFFYNFAGQSGGFVFGQDVNHTPLTIPYKPLKITYSASPYPGSFTIIDEKGDSYFFNNDEISTSTVSGLLSGTSSWYLTSMISADKSDTIKFYYNPDPQTFVDNSYSFTQNLGPMNNVAAGTQLWPMVSTTNTSHCSQVHLDSIVFKGGKVVFVSKPGRKDNGAVSLDSVIVSNYDYNIKKYSRLKSFKLLTSYFHTISNNNPPPPYNANNDTTISLNRLKLIAVQENDANNVSVKTTQFSYNNTMLPPLHNFGQDKWGYYNGYSANKTLIESQQVIMPVGSPPNFNQEVFTIADGVGANRSVSSTYMQAGILQQITYPTGGYTVFSYEANQYLAPAVNTVTSEASSIGVYQDTSIVAFTPNLPYGQAGPISFHIQLSNIANISTSFVQIVQVSNGTIVYKYNTLNASNVDTYVPVTLTSGVQYYLMAISVGGNNTQDISTLPISGISTTYQVTGTSVPTNVGGLRVKSIKDYDSNGNLLTTDSYKYGGGESGNGDFLSSISLIATQSQHLYEVSTGAGGIFYEQTYSSNSNYPLSTLSGSPVAYDEVTIYHGDSVQNIGKNSYYYTITPDSILITPNTLVPINSFYNLPPLIESVSQGIRPIPVLWKNTEPISEYHYLNNGSGQYLLQQVKSTNYDLYYRTGGRGLYVQYNIECQNGACFVGQQYTNTNDFIIYDYPISVGSRVPVHSYTTNYAPDGVTPLTQDTTNYYYGNLNHMFPTRIVSYDGKADSLVKQVMYPQDMVKNNQDPTGIYQAMITANIISPVIQVTQSKNTTQLMQSVTTYASTGGIINPLNVSLQVMANPAETRLNYQNYDTKGNLIQVAKTYDSPVSYIWGYNGAYPVAEVKNAPAKDIFFESFEDGNGNTADAKTGRYSRIGGYSRTLSGLDAGAYLLTCWQKTGTIWTLVTTPVTVSGSSYTINISSQVDDVRFYPANALMTTYTYDPLVGVTSTTDAKGLINYYEYDSFQRLVNIRDQYNNIIKSFCYNYAGQAGSCFINLPSFKSAAINQTFTKSNCSTGYTGTTVTYSLPAGTYISNVSQHVADSLAQADVAAYGQNYANSSGTCLQNIGFTVINNANAVGIQLTFYSSWGNYTYTVPSSGTTVFQVPTGTYTSLSVGPDNNYYPHHTTLGSRTTSPAYNPSGSFSPVNISTGSSDLTLTINN